MGDWVTSKHQIIAHKGNSSGCPENTTAAIESAIENQCIMVEIDVSVTSDGYRWRCMVQILKVVPLDWESKSGLS